MNPHQIESKIVDLYNAEATKYDSKLGYGIQDGGEKSAWIQDLFPLLPPVAGLNVLDCGVGTGAFAQLWLEQGCKVTGIDITQQMVDRIDQQNDIFGKASTFDGLD